MKRSPRLSAAALLVSLLLLPGCNATLLQFLVPALVLAGSTIEVVVVGNQGGGSSGDRVGAVLQLPAGFVPLGAMTPIQDLGNPIVITQNEPTLLGLYTPEPGTTLFACSGTTSGPAATTLSLRVRLQVPPGANVHTLKVALAGRSAFLWQATDPPGITNFASITGPVHVQSMIATNGPAAGTPAFREDVAGLPLYDSSGWGGVAFGDVDGDGRDDLGCIARLGNGANVLLHAGPTGWIDASNGLTMNSGRSEVAFGDFNGDSLLDLADGNGRCFLGNGGSSWTNASAGIVPFGSNGVAVGDVDHDGFDDVVFGGHSSPRLECYRSAGNGTWIPSSNGLPTTQPPTAAVAGGHKVLLRDLNADGHLDIVWCRIQAAGIWLGDGLGNWSEIVNSGIEGYHFWGVDAGDFDEDGLVDLVFGTFSYPSGVSSGQLGVRVYQQWPAAGPIWLLAATSALPTTGAYMDVAVADFDRSGSLDIAAGRAGGSNGAIELWLGTGNGTFLQAPFETGLPGAHIPNPEGLAAGDVDGDTFPDLAVASYGLGVAVYQNLLTRFAVFGEGCAGTLAAPPGLTSSGGQPVLGNGAFAWSLYGAPPVTFAFLVAGTSRTHLAGTIPLPLALDPLGAPGCNLLVDNQVAIGLLTSATGTASVPMPIPSTPSLLLAPIFGQWAVLHPPSNALGLVLSNAGVARIGP